MRTEESAIKDIFFAWNAPLAGVDISNVVAWLVWTNSQICGAVADIEPHGRRITEFRFETALMVTWSPW